MMGSQNVVTVSTMLVVMCMVLGGPLMAEGGGVSCGQVQAAAIPCIGYLRSPGGGGGGVPPLCCNAVRTINNGARTTPDRQAVCRCLKSIAVTLPGLNLPKLAALPANCGVNLPFKLTPPWTAPG